MSYRGKRSQLFVAIGAFFVIFGSITSDALPPQADKPGNEGKWSIEEGKSPTNGSPQVVAANLAGDTVLILRCKDQITEAAFSTKYNYLGYKSVDVQLQINDQNRIKEVWKASMNGRAAFAPDAVAFIQSLPDNGRVTIRTTRSDGKVKEGNFDLGAVSEVRSKIAHACVWDDTPNNPVGSVDQPGSRH
jgi:Type VI secretion system VasI, EvfG, VC_A0118